MEEADYQQLKKMRDPFPAHQIASKPKPTKTQMKAEEHEKVFCKKCGQRHHPAVIHLDYVGHAALTDRLLDVDPEWSWQPLAYSPEGLPLFDASGGLWGKLTVCGVTRMGYGNAEGKEYMDIGAREKEVIGDFLRNAAMRFGAALELWHKGTLHIDAGVKETDRSNEEAEKAFVPERKIDVGQPSDNAKVTTKITKIERKEGTATATGKGYTMYICYDDNNVKYATFSSTDKDIAEAAYSDNVSVDIEYTVGKFGRKIVTIKEHTDDIF